MAAKLRGSPDVTVRKNRPTTIGGPVALLAENCDFVEDCALALHLREKQIPRFARNDNGQKFSSASG